MSETHSERPGHCAACATELGALRVEVAALQGRMAGLGEQLETVEQLCALLLRPLSPAGRTELRRMLDPTGGDVEVRRLWERLWPEQTRGERTP